MRSDRREERIRARQHILRMGPEVIPLIRKQLRRSEMSGHFKLLERLRALKGRTPPDENSFSVTEELEQVSSPAEDRSSGDVDTFLKKRYRDALKAYKSGDYRRADRLAGAILTVAPDVPFRDRVEQFRVEVRERIVNSTMLSARIKPDKYRYEWGELVHLDVAIKNISNKTLTIYFSPPQDVSLYRSETGSDRSRNPAVNRQGDRASEQDGERTVFMQVMQEQIGMFGNSMEQNRNRTVAVPDRVRLNPRETWSKRILIRTSDEPRKHVLRRFRVKAKVRPSFIVIGDRRMSRWITFREARFELFPKGMREALPATPDKIRYHLQSGNLRDVFFLTHLLPRKHYEQIVPFFLTSLPDLNKRASRTIMVLLRSLTGQKKMYQKSSWLEWGRSTFDLDVKAPEGADPPTFERYFQNSFESKDDG